MTGRITVITGASGGIGEALAFEAARAGRRLVLVARSDKRLKAVAEAIAAQGHDRPLTVALDLAAPGAAEKLARAISRRKLKVGELVNNAGYGLTGPVERLDRAAQLEMIELNVKALTDLTLRFLPEIVAARGGVLNVASTAAYLPGPGMAIYYASKAYVLSFTEALVFELKGRVRVTALCPGPTRTGFFKRADQAGRSRLAIFGDATPERVARAGWHGFERGRRVVIPGLTERVGAIASRYSPHAALLPLSAWLTGHGRR